MSLLIKDFGAFPLFLIFEMIPLTELVEITLVNQLGTVKVGGPPKTRIGISFQAASLLFPNTF